MQPSLTTPSDPQEPAARSSPANKRMQRLGALIRKETIQILRDWRTLVFIISLPLIELFMFGYAVSLTVYHIPTAVVDQSMDARSRDYLQALVNSTYFDINLRLQSQEEAVEAIDRGEVKAAIIIPPHFATDTDKGDGHVLVMLDGSDSFSVQSGYSAASTISQNWSLNLTTEKIVRMGGSGALNLPISTAARVLYNPDLKDIWFLLPALLGLILQTLAVGQAALIVVRDREVGTVEQILVTPTRPVELILSKMIPLLALGIVTMGIVLAIGIFWFGVPFRGNLLLYFLMSVIFIVSSLGLGLLMSARAKTQREAQQMSLISMMFGTLLTGLLYPRNVMPLVPQLLGNLLPLTYFVRISRGIMSKGVGLTFVWTDAVALIFYALVVIIIASRTFKNRLD